MSYIDYGPVLDANGQPSAFTREFFNALHEVEPEPWEPLSDARDEPSFTEPTVSPWVRNAQAGTLPAKEYAR